MGWGTGTALGNRLCLTDTLFLLTLFLIYLFIDLFFTNTGFRSYILRQIKNDINLFIGDRS